MTQDSPIRYAPGTADAARQVAQLRDVLMLVRQMAGLESGESEAALDESARLSSAYGDALPIVQKRFDALAGETAAWAATCVEALLRDGDDSLPQPAAAVLVAELTKALRELPLIVGAASPQPSSEVRLPSWLC
jgi:hypothetical protein